MKLKRSRMLLFILSFLTIFVLLEFYLRSYWGFCDSVLMMESKNYEYIEQPNQNRFRFRHHVFYNSFSMRSPEPDTNAYTILGFGDSVINGGVMVDQDSLATSIFRRVTLSRSTKAVLTVPRLPCVASIRSPNAKRRSIRSPYVRLTTWTMCSSAHSTSRGRPRRPL